MYTRNHPTLSLVEAHRQHEREQSQAQAPAQAQPSAHGAGLSPEGREAAEFHRILQATVATRYETNPCRKVMQTRQWSEIAHSKLHPQSQVVVKEQQGEAKVSSSEAVVDVEAAILDGSINFECIVMQRSDWDRQAPRAGGKSDIMDKLVELVKVPGSDNQADCLTKYVDRAVISKMLKLLGMGVMEGRSGAAPELPPEPTLTPIGRSTTL